MTSRHGNSLSKTLLFLEPINPKDAEGMDVELIDSIAMVKRLQNTRILGGWESKTYAITHTNFKRILYLDADAYLVGKPDHLFFALNNHGFIFWQDLSGSDNAVKWNKVWTHGDGGVPAIQGVKLFSTEKKSGKVLLLRIGSTSTRISITVICMEIRTPGEWLL
jgi:hypothetical protein